MPSFSDSIFLFVLALLLFGPKRLPVLARELGKWVGEFRRASNEFKMQMEEELRLSEQADRQKQIAAIEAAAPISPPIEQPEHPHLPPPASEPEATGVVSPAEPIAEPAIPATSLETAEDIALAGSNDRALDGSDSGRANEIGNGHGGIDSTTDGASVLPIATSGELRIMPPSTGLPTPQRSGLHPGNDEPGNNPLGGLLDSIPEAPKATEASLTSTETAAHDA